METINKVNTKGKIKPYLAKRHYGSNTESYRNSESQCISGKTPLRLKHGDDTFGKAAVCKLGNGSYAIRSLKPNTQPYIVAKNVYYIHKILIDFPHQFQVISLCYYQPVIVRERTETTHFCSFLRHFDYFNEMSRLKLLPNPQWSICDTASYCHEMK